MVELPCRQIDDLPTLVKQPPMPRALASLDAAWLQPGLLGTSEMVQGFRRHIAVTKKGTSVRRHRVDVLWCQQVGRYLKRFTADVAAVDPVVMIYLDEALHTLRIGCLLSSTIALGCASEKLFLLLIEAYAKALPQDRQGKFRKDVEGRMIKRQYDEFSKHLESAIKPKLPADLKDDLDVHVLGAFTLIRNMRNDVGHPTGKVIDRQQANANLILFPVYAKHVYRLIDWLNANPF